MIVRFLTHILLPLAAWLLLPGSVAAVDLLARADTQMSVRQQTSVSNPSITEVVVRKEQRRLDLMEGDTVFRSYRVSLGDNPTGHKLFEGDERTPEGRYTLDWRNPESDFYKSIHISYPNEQDLEEAGAWGLNPGGSIMIHGLPNNAGDLAFAFAGLDWTDGCIAVSNEEMDEIWSFVENGTPIHILP